MLRNFPTLTKFLTKKTFFSLSAHPLCRALHGDADGHCAAAVHLEAEGVHRALQWRAQPEARPRGPEAAGAGAHQRPPPPLAGTQRAGWINETELHSVPFMRNTVVVE